MNGPEVVVTYGWTEGDGGGYEREVEFTTLADAEAYVEMKRPFIEVEKGYIYINEPFE